MSRQLSKPGGHAGQRRLEAESYFTSATTATGKDSARASSERAERLQASPGTLRYSEKEDARQEGGVLINCKYLCSKY